MTGVQTCALPICFPSHDIVCCFPVTITKSKGGMKSTIDLLVEIAKKERIQLIHANDSMDVLGSLKDRHANLGEGEIGTKPFEELLAHPAVVNAPLILETPGEEPEHGREVALLKKMRDK